MAGRLEHHGGGSCIGSLDWNQDHKRPGKPGYVVVLADRPHAQSVSVLAESLAAEVGALRKAIDGWEGKLARAAAVRDSPVAIAPGGGPGAEASGIVPSGFKGLVEGDVPSASRSGDPSAARDGRDGRDAKDGGSIEGPSRIEAKVKVVQAGVLVLDKGSRAGVREGREFEIRKGDRRVRVRVDLVRPDLCGATVVSGDPAEVKPGDPAVSEGR